jgi:hypothetical protein
MRRITARRYAEIPARGSNAVPPISLKVDMAVSIQRVAEPTKPVRGRTIRARPDLDGDPLRMGSC